ncbi:hypothetical protein PISMIDRAFT_120291 [Pisolithus microcarpus 441]|uniref:DDE Tnp4 domain-containing protein n=1 Tax=Pisolithus microcarpus 441 TaxID=765257 RepID=A0A0C9YQX2_9AGAM|nr:hypothetical protein PISMIDRAFT_120291 [Pisolithus microcarpus 441]
MVDTLLSLLETSEASFIAGLTLSHQILTFKNTIVALTDEVEKLCYLAAHTKAPHAPQLQLLEEWCLNNNLKKFRRKLCVDPDVFTSLIRKLENHPVFSNNSHNPQLPVLVQLTIFLNGVSHYGNGATTEDITEWAGVLIGTVYNCYHRVMIALLQLHSDIIHFDPMEPEDQQEWDQVKQWVESRSCPEWRGGFMCVDGSPFNLFQKPGWHGEGFYDHKSHYLLSAQVIILPHNLRIIDYVIRVPGSLHNSNIFSRTRIYRHPETFLGANKWIWADSVYPSLPWCVVPFKRSSMELMPNVHKIFNQHLSKVCI